MSQEKTSQPNIKTALKRLVDGNARFVAGTSTHNKRATPNRREELVQGQAPFAIILGCSDSRVPAEIVFDQGLGDLFVIRIAGNIVAPSQIGSIEFAIEMFGTPLVIVLGHSQCGAISATVDALVHPEKISQCAHIGSIVKRIEPSVRELLQADLGLKKDILISKACKANIRASVNQLRHSSEYVENLLAQGKLAIRGAEYDLESGVVNYLDEIVVTPEDL